MKSLLKFTKKFYKRTKNLYAKYSLAVVYQRLSQFKQAKNIYYELLKGEAENKDEIINNIIVILTEESPREAIYMLTRLTIQNPSRHYLFASMALAYEKFLITIRRLKIIPKHWIWIMAI